jgi:hypothetical protein
VLGEAPDSANGADRLRISPWTADDLRAPLRPCIVTDWVAYAREADERTLSVRLEESLGATAPGPRPREAVADPHAPPKSQGQKPPASTNGAGQVEVRRALGARSSADAWRLSRRANPVRRLTQPRVPAQRRRFRQKTPLAQERLTAFQPLLPPALQVSVLCDRGYASKRWRTCCRRQHWHVVGASKAKRQLDDQQLAQWPQALPPQRDQRVQRPAPAPRPRPSLVQTLPGQLPQLPLTVGGLSSPRPPRAQPPQDVRGTDRSWSAQHLLPIYHKRWPSEGDHGEVTQPWGLADFRVPSDAATEKWFAVVWLTWAFLPWRVHPAPAEERLRSVADVVRPHRSEHARTLWETACQEAAQLTDYLPVFKRFLCQPT